VAEAQYHTARAYQRQSSLGAGEWAQLSVLRHSALHVLAEAAAASATASAQGDQGEDSDEPISEIRQRRLAASCFRVAEHLHSARYDAPAQTWTEHAAALLPPTNSEGDEPSSAAVMLTPSEARVTAEALRSLAGAVARSLLVAAERAAAPFPQWPTGESGPGEVSFYPADPDKEGAAFFDGWYSADDALPSGEQVLTSHTAMFPVMLRSSSNALPSGEQVQDACGPML